MRSLGEEAYVRFCEQVGVSVEEARGKAIVIASYKQTIQAEDKIYVVEGDIARYHAGDVISGVGEYAGLEIPVLVQTTERPMF